MRTFRREVRPSLRAIGGGQWHAKTVRDLLESRAA